MNFEIETHEDDREPKNLAPPPDYNSPQVKARLLVLVGGLMLVLLLMNEARKPKNWLWMGFESDGTQKETTQDDGFVYEEVQHAPRDRNENQELLDSETEAPNENRQNSLTDSENRNPPLLEDSFVAQEDFWLLLYNQLELPERRTLFTHLRKLRNSSEDAALTPECGKVVEKIEGMTQSHAAKLLGQMSLVDERNPLKEKMAQQFKAFNDQWSALLKPILIRERTLDAEGKRLLGRFQAVMDRAAFADVLDNTPITRAADDPAWLRTWEDLIAGTRDEPPLSVTPIQLKAQSDFYRNQMVKMNGELRGVEVVTTRNNPLGVERFYSLWIKPERSAVQPYNVFVTQLPAGLELSENRFTPFAKILVDVESVFFKVRSYEDSSGAISETPLLLATSFRIVSREEVAQQAEDDVPARIEWQPTRTTLIAFFVGMPLLAGLIAFFAYRSTTSKSYKPGKVVTGQIHDNLDGLSDDPTIQTVQERLQGLERNED